MPSSKKNSDIQYKAAPQGMVNLDEAEGIVECFVAGIGNKDSVGDVCAPGAFGKSLIRRKPRVVWGHNWNDPIGKVLDMYEVPPSDPRLPGKMKAAGIGGLYARVQFNLKSEKGREAFANVAFFGEEQEWSIGYKTINAKFDPQMQANILYEVELYEVSPVLHGANQLTGTISIKSEDQSSAVLVNEQPSIDGLTVNELSSVLDALKTIASSTDEKCGPGMPMGTPMVMPSAPKPMQTSAPRDVVKPEVPSMPENPMLVAIRRELASRTGANIIVRSAAGNTVLFDRITSDGVSSTYKLPFHYMNGEFMFGKPEKVNVQATPESSAPEMPGMPQQFGGYEATTAFDAGKSLISFDDAQWGEGFGQQIPAQQVDVSTLNSVISNLEKIIEEKSTYIISVDIENMFQVKQAIDPVLDYYRVDATVTEDGIIVKSLDSEFLDAMDIATKGVLRSIGNMVDRAVDRPNIGGGRNRRDRTPNLASRGRGIGSRGAVVRLSDGTMWDPKNAPDRNNNGIVGEGLTDGRGMSLSQPDPTPDGPDSVGAPKTPGITNVNKTPKEPKRTAVVLDDVKPLPKRTMTTAPGTPPKRTAMTTAPGTPPKRTAERLSSGMDSASRMEMMQNDPVGYYKYLVDSGRFDPDSDDAMDYIRDEGLPKYLLSYGEGRNRSRFPESTATYGGSGLSGAEKMEILDGIRDSSNPLVKKILGTTKPSRLSDKQWAVLNNEFKRNKKKAPSGYVGGERSGGTVAPGAKLDGGIAYLEPDHASDKDYENLRDAIQTAMNSNQMLRFDYSGKNREVIPVKIEKNNKTGKWNLTAQDDTGARKLFSLDKITPSSAERLSSGEWTKTDDGFEMDAPDIDGGYQIQGNSKDGFVVTRFADARRNGGQDANEYEHDKVFTSSSAAKKWAERNYELIGEEIGKEDVEIRKADAGRSADLADMTPEEAADYAAYMEEETWRDRDDRFSSGEITWVDLAKEEAGDDPKKLADFLLARGVIDEEDHPTIKKLRATYNNFNYDIADDEVEKAYGMLADMDAEDADFYVDESDNPETLKALRDLGYEDAENILLQWDSNEVGQESYLKEYGTGSENRSENVARAAAQMFEDYVSDAADRQADRRAEGGQRLSSGENDYSTRPEEALDSVLDAKDGDAAWDTHDEIVNNTNFENLSQEEAEDVLYELDKRWKDIVRGINNEWNDEMVDRLTYQDEAGLAKILMREEGMSASKAKKEAARLQDLWDVANQAEETHGMLKRKLEAHIESFNEKDNDRLSSGLLQTIAQNPTTYAILGGYIWGMAERRNREDSYDDDFGDDDEEGRLSSGMDFDKKGASGLREMRHAERNPLRYDSPEDKAARDSYEETVANFIKNNGWFVEVPMYNGDPKWQNEDWYRAREFATNVAKLRFEDDYLNGFMQVFDKPGKPSKKDFFAKKGTVDYKSWYVNKTTQITSDIDNVLKSDQYSDNFKESYMNAVRSFLYVNRPEFGPYASDDSVKAYDAWLQQAGLGWGGRYSNSGPSLDDMRLSSGARTGSKKDNYIQSYDNPQDLKEAMFAELIANNMNDYEGMTAEDLAYALNVRSVHVEPLLDEVKKDITQAMDDYELYLDSRPEMTDEEMYAMANDFARSQTVTDKFADMTDEEAADYAAYMEEETWGDRLSSGAKGKTPEERITNFHNDMAEQGAIEEKFDIDNARSFDEMSSEEQLDLFESVSERLSETNPSALEDLEAGGLSIDEYLSEHPRFHPDFPSKDTDNARFSSGRTFTPPKPRRAPRKAEEGLLDIIETMKGNAGSDWANGFVESILDQNVKFRGKLTDSQWDNIARIVREKGSAVTADALKPQKGPRLAKYSGKRRKIVGLDEVESYDYPGVEFKPNLEQSDAIDAMMTGSDVKVGALAATGKTTTVISFANRLRAQDPTARVAYLVFNRAAKDDAIDRGMGDNVSVMTMDGITHKAMIGNSGMPGLRPGLKNKMYDEGKASIDESVRSFKGKAAYLGIRGAFIPREDDAPLELTPTDIYKIVAKGIDAYAISADDAIGPQHFTGAFNGNLAIPEDSPIMSDVLKYANKMWEDLQQDRDNLKKQGMLDFSSNHLTKMWALTGPDVGSFAGEDGVNVIMIDEAQDINPVFAKMMKEAQSAQKIYIGDTNQAINAWRGADGSTLDAVEAEYDMPITESYRFGAKIAGIGNRFLTLLGVKERMTGKKTKAGRDGSRVDVPGEVKEIDAIDATMILCRSNGGAIAATMEVITQSNGKKKVYGSANFKKDLQNFIDNIEWMQNSAAGDPHWTNSYGKRQTDRPEFSADLEGITTIEEFNKEVASGDNNRLNMLDGLLKKHSIEELREALDGILTKKEDLEKLKPEDYVKIQTAHTSKGLESGKVKIWSDFRKPKLDEETGEYIYPNQQELRLSYVAVTRAEEEIDLGSLSWITDHTVDADELPNPPSDRLSSGRSVTRRQGSGKNSRARGQRPWSDEDRQAFADGDKLRAQTVPGKRRQGPSAGEFSSGARFTPDGESGSRLQRRLSSGDLYGPPPTGSDKYDSKKQVGATMAAFHTDPGTAVIPSDMSGVLGPVPNGRQSHVLNAAAAKNIIDNPDMEYSADNGWPVDAGKLLDFIEVNEEDAIRTLREIGDAQRISTILGIPESDAQDMLDGKPVYIASSTAADMFDSLQASGSYPDSVRGLNDVARVWGFEGAPKWVRTSDIATPEFDLDENDQVNWSKAKWDGLSKAQFDAEVGKGKNPPEPVYTSPVEFFNGDAIASNPKWDSRAGSFKNPTVDSEFSVAPKKLSRAEQLEPTRMPSQARVGQRTGMADKDFAGKWIKRGHGVSAENMMDILGIKRDSEGETTTSDIKKLLVALNDIREKAGLPLIGNDGEFRPATISETKNRPMSDDVMHALITSGKFKSMKEVVAALGDPRLDSLASEYDSRMLVDAALIRIKDKMNKDGVPDSNKIIAKAMTTALGRKTDIEARVKEGRVSIKGEMKEDGMIGDAKIAEILESVNETLARSGYPEISQDELFPKDETGGYVDNLSSTIPGATRMSSGQRFIARTSSSRRADAMNDAATRRENTSSRLSSGASLPLQDEDGKIVPGNIEQAAREAVPSGGGIDNALMIQRKTPQKNLEEFEKAVKLRQEISNLFTANRKNTQGFTVYDFQDELTKAGFSLEEAEKMVDSVADLDTYIDDVESHFDDARSVMSDSIEEIDDSLNKVERLQKEKANIIKKWGESDGEVLLAVINDKISNEMAKIDKAYQRGLGGDEGKIGALHPQVEKLLRDMPGWTDRWNGRTFDINKELLDIEMAISKAGGMKKAVAITGIDFGVPEGTRLSSGRADEYYQNLTSHLINMIEKSQKEGGKWDAPWHRAGNIPRNASTKNMYSGGNLFALMLASEEKGYTTPQWAGFQQWKKLGGTVRKGEKATVILIPRQLFGEEIDDNGVKIRKSKGVSFSTAHVFNFDQIDGIDREEFLKTPTDALTPEQRVGKLEDAIKEIGATIKTGDGSRAYYSPSEDHVVMPPFELFKSPEGYYGTLAHELVHWTGHSSRLDRKNMNQFGSPDYAREELVAEFGSAFLLAMFDLSAEPREDHAHYLASWLKVLREEPNALQEASIKAQAASKLLIEKMKAVLAEMGEPVSDAESVVDVKSLQIFNDPLYEVKDAYIEWSRDPFNAPFLVKSLDAQKHSSGLVNRSWERIAETAIFLERLSRRKK